VSFLNHYINSTTITHPIYSYNSVSVFTGLPVDLQYLPEDKKREEDPDIRKMLLETLILV